MTGICAIAARWSGVLLVTLALHLQFVTPANKRIHAGVTARIWVPDGTIKISSNTKDAIGSNKNVVVVV